MPRRAHPRPFAKAYSSRAAGIVELMVGSVYVTSVHPASKPDFDAGTRPERNSVSLSLSPSHLAALSRK